MLSPRKLTSIVVALAALAGAPKCAAQNPQPKRLKAVNAEPLDHVPKDAILLHDNWYLGQETVVGKDGARFSSPDYRPVHWYRTTVPTTVLGALVRLGKYPNPYIGMNNNKIPDATNPNSPWSKPWWFRRSFTLPESARGKTVWLHLDGINYRADVWVNGVKVADEHDVVGMFRRFRFNISKTIRAGQRNAVVIRIFPNDVAGVPGFLVPGSDIRFQENVTEMSALGWDWVPPARDRNMGLWQDVWIETTGPVAVRDPAAFTQVKLPGGQQAKVTLRFMVQNDTNQPQNAEITADIRPNGFPGPTIRIRKHIMIAASATQEVILTPSEFRSLIMRHPHLWWPHGYGGQPLYHLTVAAFVHGKKSDQKSSNFGVRTIGYFYRPAKYSHTMSPVPDGQSPYSYPPLKAARIFTVNGRPIRLVGGAMVPDFMLTWSAQDYRDQVRLMTAGNQDVVRVWGGGTIMPDVFYDAADRRGLLVWQDLARTSFAVAWGKKQAEIPPVNAKIYLANMRDTILRLRGHASLLVWCGTNEAPEQANIGKALQNDLLPKLDGTRPWLPSSSTEPRWAKEPLGMRSFGPYSIQPILDYFHQYADAPDFRFKNELGLESVPVFNSIAKAIPSAGSLDSKGSWETQALRDHGFPFKKLTPFMERVMGKPVSLADFTGMAQLLSAQSLRAIYDAANKNRPRNSGTMLWMTNAAWLDGMFQLYDWYLHPTAGYYAVKSASRKLHVMYAADDHSLYVVSILPHPVIVRVRATLTSALGVKQAVKQYRLTVPADSTTRVGPAPWEIADGRLHFLALDLMDPQGHKLDHLVMWVQKDEHWARLLALPPVHVAARVISTSHPRPGETRYRVQVVNHGRSPAVQLWVSVDKGPLGEEVLPSFWSDNAFTLLPGEQRTLTVSFRQPRGMQQPLRLMVEGFNVIPREFGIVPSDLPTPIGVEVTSLKESQRNSEKVLVVRIKQTGDSGPRTTVWPVPLKVDGHLLRTFRVALHSRASGEVDVPLSLLRGAQTVQVGNRRWKPPWRSTLRQ